MYPILNAHISLCCLILLWLSEEKTVSNRFCAKVEMVRLVSCCHYLNTMRRNRNNFFPRNYKSIFMRHQWKNTLDTWIPWVMLVFFIFRLKFQTAGWSIDEIAMNLCHLLINFFRCEKSCIYQCSAIGFRLNTSYQTFPIDETIDFHEV